MKTPFTSNNRGGAFVTVLGFCVMMMLLIGSVLKYSTSERQANNRSKLLLESRTAAEGISEYGMSQVKKVLESNRTFTDSTWSSSDESLFVPGGTYAGLIAMPDASFWGGSNIVSATTDDATKPLMHVGKIMKTTGLYYVDPTNPDNESDTLKGKRIFRYDLDILSRATANDKFTTRPLTKYMKQTFAIRAVPLFSNAVFYNMDLELQPGPNMIITGSTHTNARLFARSASASPTYVNFAGPVTAVKGFWTNFTTSSGTNLMPFFQSYNDTGALQTNATTGLVQILPAGSTTYRGMRLTADTSGFSPNLTNGTWAESTWNLAPTGETWQQHLGDATPTTETVTSKTNFANWIQQTFLGNLLTNVNGILPNKIQGIPDYTYVYGSAYPDPLTGTSDSMYTYHATGNDINNSAHALVDSPRLTSAASYYDATEGIKYARRVGLYIVANTTGFIANGHKPDGTVVRVAPISYRVFKNDGTEVILPGQDTWGDDGTGAVGGTTNPGRPNPYTEHKNARPIVQMRQIDFDGSVTGTVNMEKPGTQRRMTDMRRTAGGDIATNDATTTFIHSTARSASNTYVPKLLNMIDLDMMELKKAIRTISVATGSSLVTTNNDYYVTGLPATYANFIYNPAATATNVTLGGSGTVALGGRDLTRIITTDTATLTNAYTTTDWNGGVYIESIAADQFDTTAGSTAAAIALRKAKTHELHNSGVRIINGRGKVPSLTDTDMTGFTLATNDAVYILGHFNADGVASTPATVSRLVPSTPGESTGHYYESGELPASIVADAIYLLSQPRNNSVSNQDEGWNDAFSDYAENVTGGAVPNNWIAAWATTPPSNANRRDGRYSLLPTVFPYRVPYDAGSGVWITGGAQQKLPTPFTEYSTAMLCGLVPTGKNGFNQTSGGLHNFPRFLEFWDGEECRIRGAMVALFECRVANDPWNLRTYGPPNRIWGFNLLFDTGVMPPLTPKTVQIRRVGANDITKTDYNAKLTTWGYTTLP